jgi:hypothetical protein
VEERTPSTSLGAASETVPFSSVVLRELIRDSTLAETGVRRGTIRSGSADKAEVLDLSARKVVQSTKMSLSATLQNRPAICKVACLDLLSASPKVYSSNIAPHPAQLRFVGIELSEKLPV